MEAISKSKIVKVKLENRKSLFEVYWVEKVPEVKFLGFTIKKEKPEGFYEFTSLFNSEVRFLKDVSNYVVIDKKIYYKPMLVFYFSDNLKSTKQFDTDQEAIDYFNTHFGQSDYLVLTKGEIR